MTHAASPVIVVIPVFNCERYVGEAIDSALGQTRPPAQVIVVDDGSADLSLAVARRYEPRVQVVSRPHLGGGAARNAGAALAQHEFLAFLDADDLWAPDKLERQLDALAADADLDMVFGQARQFASPDLDDAVRARLGRDGEVLSGYFAGAMLIRRAAFERVGLFAPHLRVGEFIDWYARAVDLGLKGHMLSQVLVHRRMHADNQTVRERHAQVDYARVLKAHLDRRRNAAGG
jgi:glycosyltransferase involved in cell wall biosynthesis